MPLIYQAWINALVHLSFNDGNNVHNKMVSITNFMLPFLQDEESINSDTLYRWNIHTLFEYLQTGVDPWSFLSLSSLHRRAIYTKNTVEAANRQIRKVIKTKGLFPNDQAAIKLVDYAYYRVGTSFGAIG